MFYYPRSDIASKFRPCYAEWLKRSGDIDPGVRVAVVQCLTSILAKKSGKEGEERELTKSASDVMGKMIRGILT